MSDSQTLNSSNRSSSPSLEFCRVGGNGKAWRQLSDALREQPHRAVLVHGPSGVGKSWGVRAVARVLKRAVTEVNASEVASTAELIKQVTQVAKSRTLQGARLLLVEDVEGFDNAYLLVLARLLAERNSTDGPLVLTCSDAHAPQLRAIRAATDLVRLYAPSATAMAQAMRAVGVRPPRTIGHANYHQLFLRATFGVRSCPDAHATLFASTEALLTDRRTSVEQWMRSAEGNVLLVLLAENYPNLLDDVDALAAAADTLSEAARVRDETTRLEWLGMWARRALHAPRVPALRLSKRARVCRTSDITLPAALRQIAASTDAL